MEARTPYRSRVTETVHSEIGPPKGDRDLLPAWLILWVAAASRVLLALWHREVFRADATLALVVVALIPWLVLRPCFRSWWDTGARSSR